MTTGFLQILLKHLRTQVHFLNSKATRLVQLSHPSTMGMIVLLVSMVRCLILTTFHVVLALQDRFWTWIDINVCWRILASSQTLILRTSLLMEESVRVSGPTITLKPRKLTRHFRTAPLRLLTSMEYNASLAQKMLLTSTSTVNPAPSALKDLSTANICENVWISWECLRAPSWRWWHQQCSPITMVWACGIDFQLYDRCDNVNI